MPQLRSGAAGADGESVGVCSGTKEARRPPRAISSTLRLIFQLRPPPLPPPLQLQCFSWHRLGLVSMPHPPRPPPTAALPLIIDTLFDPTRCLLLSLEVTSLQEPCFSRGSRSGSCCCNFRFQESARLPQEQPYSSLTAFLRTKASKHNTLYMQFVTQCLFYFVEIL